MDRKYGEYQKILLNLKWFVKQLCRVFEEKLERRCSREEEYQNNKIHRDYFLLMSPRRRQNHRDIVRGLITGPSSLCGDSSGDNLSTHSTPRRNKPRSQAHQTSGGDSGSAVNRLSWTYSLSNSLTNSPLIRRISSGLSSQHRLHDGSSSNSVHSNGGGHNRSSNKMVLKPLSRLGQLRSSTSRAERDRYLRRFGEHVAVVYEYQLGMLASLHAVSVVVTYVVELLLKAIRKGVLLGLSPSQLNPTVLFDNAVLPKSLGSKLVKTVGIGIHSNSLTWKVSSIFTHPGLRHNQVGGEDCTNLSIVTHLLTGYCPFGESRRPDIYGYRNLIVVPRRRQQHQRVHPDSTSDSNTTNGDERLDKKPESGEFDTKVPEMFAYEVSLYDATTLSRSSHNHQQQQQSPLAPPRSPSHHQHSSGCNGSTNSLLDHIHKCYKSIFFLIYERPAVIEHLMSCHSFRVFCSKELITPVMFLASVGAALAGSRHSSLFTNFDLFNICVTPHPAQQHTQQRSSKAQTDTTFSLSTELADRCSLYSASCESCEAANPGRKEYDNFGFDI